jgi:HlyD family secretion protein
MSIKRIVIIVVVVGIIAAVLVMNLGPKEKVKLLVETEAARMEAITQVVTASGKIRPETQVKVSADVGGYIRKLTVEEGQSVEKGQLLVEVDPEIYRAQVMAAQAAEKTAQARVKLAEASLVRAQGEARRVRGLYRKDLTSAANLEKAQADLQIAQAEVDAAAGQLLQAQASLSRARKDLQKCTISAPMSGTVIELLKELGERVSGGDFREDIIMTVADLSRMEVEVEVGERDVVLIHEQDPVEIEVDAYPGEKFPGTVNEIANAGVTRNQWTESEVTNFRVVVLVGDTDKVLRPQMSATVSIKTAHKDQALTVPIQSVTLRRPAEISEGGRRPGGKPGGPPGPAARPGARKPGAGQPVEVVFVVEDGRALAREVKTGLSSDSRIEILSGIQEGTKVVSGPFRALSKDLKHKDEVRTDGPGPGKQIRGRRGPPRKR